MTTMFPQSKKCAMCDTESEHMMISSTSSFGSMDLDTRPPPLERHNLAQEIQHCAACGFCAVDIEELPKVGPTFIESPSYRAILEAFARPELARQFEAAGSIASEEGRHADAGWFLLKAAWVCDDEEAVQEARGLRRDALRSWELASSVNQAFAQDEMSEHLMQIDVMRRACLFDDAVRLMNETAEPSDEFLHSILSYERQLIGMKDDTTHTIDEALERS